jgi:hypothetical protein
MEDENCDWGIDELISDQHIYAKITKPQKIVIENGVRVLHEDVPYKTINAKDIIDYKEGDILVFFSCKSNEEIDSCSVIKPTNLEIEKSTSPAHFILLYKDEENQPHKKVKKTSKNVSDAK